MRKIPRIIIAGTHSGCGKTTVASGIMAALTSRGVSVQPFKVGPDFIDPSHHAKICGRPSRNLDPFMMGEDGVRRTFCNACGDTGIAVIEGVMGLFDGIDGTDLASTAHVARILDAPVILVIDAKGMSSSAHALIKGFRDFDPRIRVAGVIFNRIGSERHRDMIRSALRIPSFGWLPRTENLAVASRHLGLEMAHETGTLGKAGKFVEEFCDLDAISALAHEAPPVQESPQEEQPARDFRARIGVALDDAFCFYYPDNFDRLREAGAELVFFSPLAGEFPEVDAIYFGGGYPELHLERLEKSRSTAAIRSAAESGTPIYAECGGLLYLCRDLSSDGGDYRMCDVLPGKAEMTNRVRGLGYVEGSALSDGAIFPQGTRIRGHEFHYSRVQPDPGAEFAFRLDRGKGIDAGRDGLTAFRTVGTYTHAYFSGEFARLFMHTTCSKKGD